MPIPDFYDKMVDPTEHGLGILATWPYNEADHKDLYEIMEMVA